MIKVTYDIKLGSADHSDMITPFLINTKKSFDGSNLCAFYNGAGDRADIRCDFIRLQQSFQCIKKGVMAALMRSH